MSMNVFRACVCDFMCLEHIGSEGIMMLSNWSSRAVKCHVGGGNGPLQEQQVILITELPFRSPQSIVYGSQGNSSHRSKG